MAIDRSAADWFGRSKYITLACLLYGLLQAPTLFAQVDQGSVSGTVLDPTGAVVPNAKVTLLNKDVGLSLETTTKGSGEYIFTPVRIGNYSLSVTAPGFATTTQENLRVEVAQHLTVNVQLKTGATTETVEVSTAPPLLQAEEGSVGQVITERSVNSLPLNGRNFTFLAQLGAGVNSPQADTRGNAASGAFAANGLRPAQNNYMLDGIDNNSDTVDFLNGTNYVVLPPVDAVQEFKVQTSDFSAEFGRSGAAVLNATIKSGTNSFHGDVWEFFRNDKLDAADFFENAGRIKKGELRLNQFGFTAGGPVIIPKIFNGRNKVFFFGDYEGLRRAQGTVLTGSVPTTAEIASGYTNFQDLITGQSGTQADALGRIMPTGTVLDPATTRQISPGVFVRDPFGTCGSAAANFAFTLAGCNLNHLPAGRLDANAIKLLNLYPNPTDNAVTSLFSNFADSPALREDRNAFDSRLDINFSEKDTLFFRFSYVDDPQLIPAIFGGIPDGGGFQEGNQTANAQQSALGWTHTISPALVNEVRAGLNYLHTTRVSPAANDLSNLPLTQGGVVGIPQLSENGGLPAFGISGLATLGSNAFLPSDEVSSTFQITDDVTKIYSKHTFKMGFEFQHVKFSTLQPPWSRGQFDYSGLYTEIPGVGKGKTGRAQFLLTPTVNSLGTGANFPDFVGGPSGNGDDGGTHNGVFVSNISLTDNGKNYYGSYINDDWKITPKLTLNVGLRWDFFGLVLEHHGNQANFIPSGGPLNGPTYLMPGGKNSCNNTFVSVSFTTLLAQDKIKCLATNAYGSGLGHSQKTNFAPRFGFAYQVSPKLVARGGFGIFYNGFENRGFSPNIGENYPFQFNFQFQPPDAGHPIAYAGCTSPTATPIGSATLETGFSCTPLDPLSVIASGLALRGIQFDYLTPYSMGGNLTLQYQLTPSMSVQAGYVTSLARHLESFPGSNRPSQIVPTNLPPSIPYAATYLPFPDYGEGASYAATEGDSV